MIAAVRTSKRALVVLVVLGFSFVACLFLVKDINDKLTVMTTSNAEYQKMTDIQGKKIKDLTADLERAVEANKKDLKSCQEKEASVKDNLHTTEERLREAAKLQAALQANLSSVKSELGSLRWTQEAGEDKIAKLLRDSEDLRHAKAAREAEMNEKYKKLNNQYEGCRYQYSLLFKEYQPAVDGGQSQMGQGHRQKQAFSPSTAEAFALPPVQGKLSSRHLSTASSLRSGFAGGGIFANSGQLALPNGGKPSSHSPQALTSSKLSKADSHLSFDQPQNAGKVVHIAHDPQPHPPVGAHPPIEKYRVQDDQQFHVGEEDVMETPTFVKWNSAPNLHPLEQPKRAELHPNYQFRDVIPQPPQLRSYGNHFGSNLDRQDDDAHQDHPELPVPLDAGRLDNVHLNMEEENEADDAADGRIFHRYPHEREKGEELYVDHQEANEADEEEEQEQKEEEEDADVDHAEEKVLLERRHPLFGETEFHPWLPRRVDHDNHGFQRQIDSPGIPIGRERNYENAVGGKFEEQVAANRHYANRGL